MRVYCVYKHTCPNNKVYVGITSNLNQRFRHRDYRNNKHFYDAIQKYGWDNIKHEILYTDLTKEEAEVKEIELIAKYKSNDPKFGYNIRTGGSRGGIKIKQFDKNGRLLNLFDSIKDASKITGICSSAICQVCKQNRQSAGGYIWRYEHDDFLSNALLNAMKR